MVHLYRRALPHGKSGSAGSPPPLPGAASRPYPGSPSRRGESATMHASSRRVKAKQGRVTGNTKIQQVYDILEATYGERHNDPSFDPLDGLIGTILSQATSDVNSHRAHRALRDAYPDWDAVLAAPDDELAGVIRSGGLADLKARRIKDVLATIRDERGDLDLAFLADLPLDDALAWLRHLPGVGPKTAACVLMFDLDRPALPVDTHVHRVARRLGLIGPRVSAEAAHAILEA